MKRSILTLAAGIVLGLGTISLFAFKAQPDPAITKSGDICIVRTTMGSSAWSKVITTYPDGTTEVVKLANFDPQNFVHNNETVTQQLNKVRSEGYRLIGTNGGGAGGGFVVAHYIFEKQ